jgi:hypothetical protein
MRIRQWAFGIGVAAVAFASQATAQQFASQPSPGLFSIFDEVRGGIVYPVQPADDSGVTFSGQLYFRNFVPPYRNYWANAFLRPRFFIGGNVATGSRPIDQAYAGLAWRFPFRNRYFVEASLGGTIDNGPIASDGDGLDLGCHYVFRESLALGADLTQHWSVMASVDHSSHANLCSGGNSGITHAGVYVGYRF